MLIGYNDSQGPRQLTTSFLTLNR